MVPSDTLVAHWRFSFPYRYALVVAVLVGCSKSPTPVARQSGANTSTAVARKPPKDESLTTLEYVRLGVPSPDRDWSGSDMLAADKVMLAIAQKSARELPRHKSEHSGALFARITSPQNLELFKNKTLPIGARLPDVINYNQGLNQISKLYLAAYFENSVQDMEVVELIGAQLRSAAVSVELLDEFLPTIKKDDPTYEVRMQGLERVKLGLAGEVAGSLQTLTEKDNHQGTELIRLIRYMQETFPIIVPRLTPTSQAEVSTRLDKMQADESLTYLQPGLRELRSKVKVSLEPTGVR